MNDSQLMSILKFNESDLQANRSGQISKGQTTRLAQLESRAKKQSVLGGIGNLIIAVIGIGGAIGFVFTMPEGDTGWNISLGAICFGSIFGIFWPLLWGTAGITGLRRAFARVDATLKKAEGPINIEKTIRSSYDSDSRVTTRENVYELRVGGYTFRVHPALQNYMKQGDSYTVYFADFNHAERSKEILSVRLVENIGSNPSPKASLPDDVEITELVKKGYLLEAIRLHRSIHGTSLEEARAMVEDIRMRQ